MEPEFDKAAIIEAAVRSDPRSSLQRREGRRMVSFKFETAGRYGVHEAVFSPELDVRSEQAPADDSLEITEPTASSGLGTFAASWSKRRS